LLELASFLPRRYDIPNGKTTRDRKLSQPAGITRAPTPIKEQQQQRRHLGSFFPGFFWGKREIEGGWL